MAPYTGTIPSGTLAVGAGLPAAWTQQVGLSLSALESAWQPYTPSQTWTLGNGSVFGRFCQIGKYVSFTAKLLLGTTTTVPAATLLSIGLPVTAQTSVGGTVSAFLSQTGTQFWLAGASLTSTTADIRSLGTNGVLGTMTSTVPFTWASTHYVLVSGVYEAL